MALVRTNVGQFHSTVNATSFTTGSFTPPSNCILVAFSHNGSGPDTNAVTISDSLGTLTWTNHLEADDHATDNFHRADGWTAIVGTAAAMTITFHKADSSEWDTQVYAYTGYDTVTPVGATAVGNTVSNPQTTFTITLSSAPALTSEVIAFGICDTGGGAHHFATTAGWTNQAQTDDTANLNSLGMTRGNSTSTTVTFTGTGANVNDLCGIAFEIRAAAAGAAIPFINYDWPNPSPIPSIDETWTWRQVGMLGQDRLPNRQQDWPLPPPIPQIDRTWVWRQTGMFGQDKLPFRQQDWPNPSPVPYPDETWIWRQVQMLGKDVLPFRQQDWPNPVPIPQIDPTWLQGFILPLRSIIVVFPHNQFDWPNPAPIPQIDSTWTQGFNLFRQPVTPVKIVSVAEPTPFGAFRTFGRFGSS